MQNSFATYGVPSPVGLQGLGAYPATYSRPRRSAWNVVVLLSLFLLPVSLVPSTSGRIIRVPLVGPLWWADCAIFIFAIVVLLSRLFANLAHPINPTSKRIVLYPLLCLGVWQCLSAAWNGRDVTLKGYSVMEAVFMMSATMAAVQLGSGLSCDERRKVARRTTILIAGIMLVYLMLSFVFPSWRPSHSSGELVTKTLGFIRVHGPLGTSTTLNFILVPALGLSLGALLSRDSIRWWWAGLSLFFLMAIIGTGSRGGLVCLAVFAFTLTVALGLRSFLVLVPITMLFAMAITLVGIPERFRSFEDESRSATYATAWRGFTSSPQAVVFGLGHGALYSRLHDESMRQAYGELRWYLISEKTSFGETLRSSHTALMRTLVETGVFGGIFLYGMLAAMALHLLRRGLPECRSYVIEGKALIAGCVAVVPNMAMDEFFVGAPWVLLVWILYVVLGTEMIRTR